LIGGFVLDHLDQDLKPAVEALGLKTLVTDTIMKTTDDRRRLASEVLDFYRWIH